MASVIGDVPNLPNSTPTTSQTSTKVFHHVPVYFTTVCMHVRDHEWLVSVSVVFYSAKTIQGRLYGGESIRNKSTNPYPIQSQFDKSPFLQLSLCSGQDQISSNDKFDLPSRPRLRSDATDPIPLHIKSRSCPLLQSLKPLKP
jgi:hypothetical protein